jgi:hypothetical protein
MNRRVTYETLWLASARDEKGRKQPFHNKTLLFGTNGTGKSRVVKNLYWVFGCNTRKRDAGAWDPDTIVGLDFKFGEKQYFVLRDGRRLGMFGADGTLLFAADSLGNWSRELGRFFGFQLQLKRPSQGNFAQAGPDYMFLPFYMDQDGGWGPDWDNFDGLTQFADWKASTFESFLGLRPNAYFEAKQLSTELAGKLRDRQGELAAQRSAFKRVEEVLPRHVPSLNAGAFRVELAELARKATRLQQDQVKLRGQLLAFVNLRDKVESEMKLASNAYTELRGDLSFLAEQEGKAIECPTCGTVHENSFHARLQISSDAESLSALIVELRNQVDQLRQKEADVRTELRSVEKGIADLDRLQQEKRAKLRLEDVLAAQSKKTLSTAFQKVKVDLGKAIEQLELEKSKHDAKLRALRDPERQKQVQNYFASQVRSLSNLLNVPIDEQIADPKAGARSQSGGSSAPRSMLAVHLAMLATNADWGDSVMFPFIVDTPAQSGQDDLNLSKMLGILGSTAGANHQVVLAAERLPLGVSLDDFDTVAFERKNGALLAEQYEEAVARLREPVRVLRERLKPQAQ